MSSKHAAPVRAPHTILSCAGTALVRLFLACACAAFVAQTHARAQEEAPAGGGAVRRDAPPQQLTGGTRVAPVKVRVITNRELEPYRSRREQEEEEYERTRGERGMPSKEEFRLRIEEQDRRLRELAARMEAERLAAEVESLSAEVANLARQLESLGLQLSQTPAPYAQGFYNAGFYPYVYQPFAHAFAPAFPRDHFRGGLHWRRGVPRHVFRGRGNFPGGRPVRPAPRGPHYTRPSGPAGVFAGRSPRGFSPSGSRRGL